MAGSNAKSDLEEQTLDTSHELPSAETSDISSRDAEIERLRAERNDLIERLARLQADFENARKRGAREQQDFREFALADAIRLLLPIVDSFELALKSSKEKSEFRSGVELIYKQLQDALSKLGLQPIVAKGEAFDPRLHEAIEMVDTTEARDHEVLDEFQRGYKLKERLLRPAMVKVARNPNS